MTTPSTPADKARAVRSAPTPLERIATLARTLAGPGGCPWDQEQTVESLTPYLQEEVYEVVEAVAERDPAGFREELGDLLFLALLLAVAGEKSRWGGLAEAADGVVEKLIRRHPHVFGDGPEIGSEGALQQWEELKRAETDAGDAPPTALGDRPKGLPALTTAFRISEKAGAVGFEWPDVTGALEKLDEELAELRAELAGSADPERIETEIGDLLYSVVNVARYLRVDPERALRGTTAKFVRRFRYVEEQLHREGLTPERAGLDRMDALWNEAKREGIE